MKMVKKSWFKRLHSKKSERAYSIIKSGDGNYLIDRGYRFL